MGSPVQPPFVADQDRLRDLVRRLHQLTVMAKSETGSRRRWEGEALVHGIDAHLLLLDELRHDVEELIAELVERTPLWSERERILTSAPGVAPTVAWILMSHMPELGDLNNSEATALAGLAPLGDTGGGQRGSLHIRGGRKGARQALYMATLAALRHNPALRSHFLKLRRRGKHSKVALVACMRKHLIILNAMIKNQRPWAPDQNDS